MKAFKVLPRHLLQVSRENQGQKLQARQIKNIQSKNGMMIGTIRTIEKNNYD